MPKVKANVPTEDIAFHSPRLERVLGKSRGLVIHVEIEQRRSLSAIASLLMQPQVKYSGTTIGVLFERPELAYHTARVLSQKGIYKYWSWHSDPSRFPEIAQTLLNNGAGPAPRFELHIDDAPNNLPDSQRVLVQRSFADCESVIIRKLDTQGLSGAMVYVAFADHRQATEKPAKVPFLVKFAKQRDVESEVSRFELYVKDHLPFHSRPNVEPTRSIYDCDMGILVGSYIERSTSLLAMLEKGWDPTHIGSLLEDCIGGWVSTASVRSAHPATVDDQRFNIRKFLANPRVLSEIIQIGVRAKPAIVLARIKRLPCKRYLHGIVHKDLNARNVLLRRNEAILIDFEKCELGPVLLDLATLDVSIAFDSFLALKEDDKNLRWNGWTRFLDEAYDKNALLSLPKSRAAYEPFSSQWQALRQIRRWAFEESAHTNEYLVLVALELLRKSQFDTPQSAFGGRTAARAFELANKLSLSKLQK